MPSLMLKACSLALLALSGPLWVPVMAVDAPLEQTQAVATTMAKRANVRFGPSQQAKVVVTLDAGTKVEVLGIAQGLPEWYVIRFPREGSAWIHRKVLQIDAASKKGKVIEDRARVRDDARQGSNIVAELAVGEEVEIKDRVAVGDWLPVYPPSAVAYVHKSVLIVPAGNEGAIVIKDKEGAKLDDLWEEVQARYGAYKGALDRDVEVAAKLDWEFLDGQLGKVVDGHPRESVKLAAKRLKDRIAPVVSAATQVQRANKITPVRDVPGLPPIAVKIDPVPSTEKPPKNETPVTPPNIDPLPTTNKPPVDTTELKKVAEQAPAAPKANEFAAQGFLEERAVAAVGTNYVLIDKNGKVCAFVKTKPGVDIQLSEFFWRLVGVKGESQPIAADKHGQGSGPIPLVLVDDVRLLR